MDKILVSLLLVFFVAFSLFASVVLFGKSFARFTRASQDLSVSPKDSLLFAWPLNIKADGTAETTITVFARTTNGKAIPDRNVTLTTSIGTVKEPEGKTGPDGKAIFHITSTTAGLAEINAMIDNNKIDRQISVKFE